MEPNKGSGQISDIVSAIDCTTGYFHVPLVHFGWLIDVAAHCHRVVSAAFPSHTLCKCVTRMNPQSVPNIHSIQTHYRVHQHSPVFPSGSTPGHIHSFRPSLCMSQWSLPGMGTGLSSLSGHSLRFEIIWSNPVNDKTDSGLFYPSPKI